MSKMPYIAGIVVRDFDSRGKMIKAVLFDFGGVLAEEGFRGGLTAVAEEKGLDPEEFFRTAEELIFNSGYLVSEMQEQEYWDALREKTGIRATDEELRNAVLQRFVLRPPVIEYARKVKSLGLRTGILSDQTNWLDEIESTTPFYHLFDFVFNSYKIKKHKKDRSVFTDAAAAMGLAPGEVLFVDDKEENTERARSAGMHTLHFTDVEGFKSRMRKLLGI